jgi:hypothetical protein
VRIEARGTTIFGNGNNLVIAGDLVRRALPGRLDPRVERPELREFSGNPVATVLADRGRYVAAALTVCRAYHVADRPSKAKRLASFEGWSDTVRSALIWLGRADPVEAMESARESDPVLGALRAMLLACGSVMGLGYRHRFRMQDVIDAAEEHDGSGAPAWPDLSAAVQGTARGSRSADAKSLGGWAQRQKGRIVDDVCFDIEANPKGGSLWWIKHQRGIEREGERAAAVAAGASFARGAGSDGRPKSKGTEYVVEVLERSAKGGIRVEFVASGEARWFPEAMLKVDERADGTVVIEVPEKLRIEKGLPAAGEAWQTTMKLGNGAAGDMGHCAPEHDPTPPHPDDRHADGAGRRDDSDLPI